MNPWHLDATGLMVWGLIAHLIADWPLQNHWMATNKAKMRQRKPRRGNGITSPPRTFIPNSPWWDRHPAAYVHAGIHGLLLAVIFGWVAVPLAVVHLFVDTRWPLRKWSALIRQTQPEGDVVDLGFNPKEWQRKTAVLYDIGTEVRFWTDQVFHIATIAVAALIVSSI